MTGIKKLWGVRHIRWWWMAVRLNLHLARCRSVGLGFFANEADISYLDAVWRGDA
jgi:hypothetical protein